MKGFVVMIRKKWQEKDLPYKQMKSEFRAELLADELYNELHLDRVAVVAVDTKGEVSCEQFSIKYTRERICKHFNTQGRFNFKTLRIEHRCEACGDLMRKSIKIQDPLERDYDLMFEQGSYEEVLV